MEQTYTLLLVDDEEDLRLLLARQFSRNGFNVIPTGKPEEALEFIRKGNRVDIILTDIRMPGSMDGVSLLKQISDMDPNHPIVVLMTGIMPVTNRMAREMGAKKLLTKPFSVRQVSDEFRSWLDPHSAYHRRHPRIPYNLPVTVKTTSNEVIITTTGNISAGGLLIAEVEKILTPSTKAKLEVEIEGKKILVDAEVRWSILSKDTLSSSGTGFQFINLDEASEKIINTFINRVTEDKYK